MAGLRALGIMGGVSLFWRVFAINTAVLVTALPEPGVPPDNPPGLKQAMWPLPGALTRRSPRRNRIASERRRVA